MTKRAWQPSCGYVEIPIRATSTVLDLGTEHIDVFPMNKK